MGRLKFKDTFGARIRDVDEVIERIRRGHTSVSVRQLKVLHPGMDNDGVWFFHHPQGEFEVQIESSTGMCPFLIETDENHRRFTAKTVERTVELVTQSLSLGKLTG